MMRLLTEKDVSTDQAYRSVIERNRDLIFAIGWADASLVEQYNLAVSLESHDDTPPVV
jgi:hypothetical protein